MRGRLSCLLLGLMVVGAAAKDVAAEPVVGVDVGAALPISTFRDSADAGGAVAPFVGYRFGNRFAVTPIIQPQLVSLPTDDDTCSCDDVTNLMSATGGVRLSLFDDKKEVYVGAQGGYYWELTGPLDDDGVGFNVSGGFNYELARGTALGLFVRRDESKMDGAWDKDDNLTFVVTGLSLQHRFLPPPPPPPPPPAPVVAQAPPPAKPAPMKKKIVLRGVNFDFDKAVIRADAKPILEEAASTLKEEATIEIAVEGHTDAVGSDSYNEKLSLRRATAVRDYLATLGIASSRMTIRGFGETQPVASNKTADGRAQNRRVELSVQP